MKKELKNINNRLLELLKVNDSLEEIDVAFKQTLDSRLIVQVAQML